MYKSNRLLRNIIRPKYKEPHKERDRNVIIFEDNNKKTITGRNLQNDHPSILNKWANSNLFFYFLKDGGQWDGELPQKVEQSKWEDEKWVCDEFVYEWMWCITSKDKWGGS